MLKIYRVEFETKMGSYTHWAIDIPATKREKAIETAKGLWQRKEHMFHVRVRVLKDTEELLYNYFTRVQGR